ncbi:MAG: ABC transporter ATP-binding protein [bacterium]
MVDAALEVTGLVAGYDPDFPILHGINIRIKKNALTLVIGPNGAGKSTLIKAIAGVVPSFSGKIEIGGKSLRGIRPDQLGQFGISYVPQTENIFRNLSVKRNIELVLGLAGQKHSGQFEELMDLFPALSEKLTAKASTLSGGQRQMLALAMALAKKPSILLMDEPSAGLSPKVAEEVLSFTKSLTEQQVTILLVEQNVKQALEVADHCYILAEGRNQLNDTAKRLIGNPLISEIFMGSKRMAS